MSKIVLKALTVHLLFFIFILSTIHTLSPEAGAYSRYNDGCQACHDVFNDETGGGTNSLNIHRNPYAMSTACKLCHQSGNNRNPYIGLSSGTRDNPGLGCMGCHGRQEDAGNDSISQGLGAGLRQHHWNTGAMVCGNCHFDANPANYTPVGEDVKPVYYGTADTTAADPCNPIPQDEINENWDLLDLVGLDNDGDGLYDGNDPDCGGCADNDNDGVSPDGGTCGLIDCNDNDPNVNPDEIDDNCDGVDNDCDGLADNDYVETPTSCGVGECAGNTGNLTCQGGSEVDTCDPLAGSTVELCDGLDNDCNGQIDEDFTELGITCNIGLGACENSGTYVCTSDGSGTQCNATPGTPGVEGPSGDTTCSDSVDNDCDGLTDLGDPQCVAACSDGDSDGYVVCDGICDSGVLQCGECDDGDPGINPGATELCDGLDNNCNGSVDESFSELDTSCTAGIGACAATGINICTADGSGTECDAIPGTPGIEGPGGDLTCTDGIDNDCDGKTDNEDTDCGEECIPPPVRQAIGIEDQDYGNLVEADCRLCHENPDQFPVPDDSIPDRHHLIYGTLIPDPTDAPFGTPGGLYACLSCHATDTSSGEIEFLVERDCLFCHIQGPSGLTVHHRTDLAQGNVPQGPDCQACHGSIVDNMNDGHFISAEPPTESIPKRSGGMGLPYNSRGNGAGACDYCHDDGTCGNGIVIETNAVNHHSTGFGFDSAKCAWCHDFTIPFEEQIRVCENCHGRDSLHNIQADSDGDGVINPGIELPFYGHIGDPDDCWGCHGYGSIISAPESGPVVPSISSVRNSVLTEGTDTTVILSGSAFTNIDEGTELYSDVVLKVADGSTITLTPDTITQNSITVTIPGNLASGNYKVNTVKMNKHSNPKTISIKPAVVISDVTCKTKAEILIITGSGFGEKPAGTDGYLNVEVNGRIVEIKSWTDTKIQVLPLHCKGQLTVTVNALFGSATWQQ